MFKAVRRRPLVFPLAIAAAVTMMVISEASYWRSTRMLNDLGTIAIARASVQGLERSILEAETGQRGYLLTGRKEYLDPYDTAIRQVDQAFSFLDQYYGEEPGPKQVLRKLKKLTETKLSELALTIRLRQEGKVEATREIVLSDIGKEQMESIRTLSAELLEHESQRVGAGRDDIYRTLLLSRVGVAALSLIGLLALFLYLRQTSAL